MAYHVPSTFESDAVLSLVSGTTWKLYKTSASLSASLTGQYVSIWGSPTLANDIHTIITGGGTDFIEFTNASGFAETINDWEVVNDSIENDWVMYFGATDRIVDTKKLNDSATFPEPLQDQGDNCRSFQPTSVDALKFKVFMLKDINFISSGGNYVAQRITSIVNRASTRPLPTLYARANFSGTNAMVAGGYSSCYSVNNTTSTLRLMNRMVYTAASYSAYSTAFTAALSYWHAHRLTVMDEDLDNRIILESCTRAEFESASPTWTTRLEILHHYNLTETLITGATASLDNYLPPKTGRMGFGFHSDSTNVTYGFVDSVTCEKMG